jgi:hypothetical protein
VSDATLNKIGPLSGATCGAGEYPYQAATVRVYADGYDVTSLATGLYIDDTSVADFVEPSGRTSTDNDQDIKDRLRGKAEGSFNLKLFNSVSAPFIAMNVSDAQVTVTETSSKVVTAIEWNVQPPSSYSYSDHFNASVTVSQTFERAPAGTTRGHYGYLFQSVTFSDGASEEVMADEIAIDNGSPNVLFTAPGGTDKHTHTTDSTLWMYNSGTDRWLVTLKKTAASECIQTSVRANFTRCSTVISSGFPKIQLTIPAPTGITFSIDTSGKQLTPTNGGGASAAFSSLTSTTSTFSLAVSFDDGSSITTYAAEPDSAVSSIVYFSDDVGCATVDNDANQLTVSEGATCNEVTIRVNVTLNGQLFQANDTKPVVRLASVTTEASVYPSGASGLTGSAYIYPLPCNAGHERFTLTSKGSLSTGETRTISSSDVSYVPTNSTAVTVSGQTVQMVAAGTGAFGSSHTEFYGGTWADYADIVFNAMSFTVSLSEPVRNYNTDTEWLGLPTSTLNLEKDGTDTTTFRIKYERDGVLVTFDDVMATAYSSWFDYTAIVSFYAWSPQYIDVSAAGTLTLKDNHYAPVKVQSFLCASSTSPPDSYDLASPASPKELWANLEAGYDDIDVGVDSDLASGQDEEEAPFYMPDPTAAFVLYVVVNPKNSQYLRSAELTITFPPGITTLGSSFTQATSSPGKDYEVTTSSDFNEDSQTVKVVAFKVGNIATTGPVYLGRWDLAAPNAAGFLGTVNTTIVLIQSTTDAACASVACGLTETKGTLAIAGTAHVYAGVPSTRRLLSGPVTPPSRKAPGGLESSRRLSECDPCVAKVYGDTDGDCQLGVGDAVKVLDLWSRRGSFVSGQQTHDPLEDEGACNHTRLQFNPLHNLLDENDSNDPRYQRPEIGVTDAVHLGRAATGKARFVQPTVECAPSLDGSVHRPDVLIRSSVLKIDGNSGTSSASDSNTHVYFDVLVTGTSREQYGSQLFNVTNGTAVEVKDGIPLNSTTSYAAAGAVTMHSVVVQGVYDASTDQWVARLQPFNYSGDTNYYVSVATESFVQGVRSYPGAYAVWLGSAMPPFGEAAVPDGDGFQ